MVNEYMKDLRSKTDAELLTCIQNEKRQLFIDRSMKSGEKAAVATFARRNIARILTVIREREIETSLKEPLV